MSHFAESSMLTEDVEDFLDDPTQEEEVIPDAESHRSIVIVEEDSTFQEVQHNESIQEDPEQVEQLEEDLAPEIEKVKPEIPKFDRDLNEECLQNWYEMSADEKIKFTNPIRDYSHLLANRLVR